MYTNYQGKFFSRLLARYNEKLFLHGSVLPLYVCSEYFLHVVTVVWWSTAPGLDLEGCFWNTVTVRILFLGKQFFLRCVDRLAAESLTHLKNLANNVTSLILHFQVNMIKDDGTVIHFNNPKVQASVPANTFSVTGSAENKRKAHVSIFFSLTISI